MEQPIVEVIPRRIGQVKRTLFALAGLIFVALGGIGVALPGFPTTPWLILASICFSRSSPRLQRWLHATPLFGPILQDWDKQQGIRPGVKLFAVLMVLIMCTLSASFATDKLWVRVTIASLGLIGICVIVFAVQTIKKGNQP